MVAFRVNGQAVEFGEDSQTPLLWVLRDHLHLYGTKYGCGSGACGACTVHANGAVLRSCSTPVAAVANMDITTIEGLSDNGEHPVQQAWLEIDVPQCGYCQAGQIMAAVALLSRIPDPSDEEIAANLPNLCRCGTYIRIRQAIHRAAKITQGDAP